MTFSSLTDSIETLQYEQGVDTYIAGYSLLGYPLYVFHVGSYEGKQIFIEGAIHAREYITASLVVELVRYWKDKEMAGGMYFLPLSNPDGVRLVLDGVDGFPCRNLREFLYNVNFQSEDFSLWKANADAVDLNVNFGALWGGGAQNVFCPAPANFVGYYPNSEREVRALINYTTTIQPDLTISYHTRGEVIYYGFETLTPAEIERDRVIVNQFSALTGYEPILTTNSTGGYSDWVSDNLRVPAFTFEVGSPTTPHPIGEDFLPQIFETNKEVPGLALSLA